MEKDEIAFSVQMTPMEIYKFTIYHSYHKASGLLGVCLSIAALIMLIVSFNELTDRDKTVLTFVAAWFLVLEPVTLFFRARSQVKRNKSYQKPLNYQMNQEGITVSQGEEQQTIAWENLMKIVATRSQYLVYSSKIHAFVFPKKAFGQDCEKAEIIMRKYTEGTGVRLSRRIKKHSDRVEG